MRRGEGGRVPSLRRLCYSVFLRPFDKLRAGRGLYSCTATRLKMDCAIRFFTSIELRSFCVFVPGEERICVESASFQFAQQDVLIDRTVIDHGGGVRIVGHHLSD